MPTPYLPFAEGAPTSSGKIELYSKRLASYGLPALPTYVPLVEGPDDAEERDRHPHCGSQRTSDQRTDRSADDCTGDTAADRPYSDTALSQRGQRQDKSGHGHGGDDLGRFNEYGWLPASWSQGDRLWCESMEFVAVLWRSSRPCSK